MPQGISLGRNWDLANFLRRFGATEKNSNSCFTIDAGSGALSVLKGTFVTGSISLLLKSNLFSKLT